MDGKYVKRPDGTPVLIGDEYGADLAGGKAPFWSDDMHTYIFDDPGQGDQHCVSMKETKGLAVTIGTIHTAVNPNDGKEARVAITLCPLTFDDSESQKNIDSRPIRSGMLLSSVQTRCLTLLHKIFHARWSQEFDSGDDEDCK